MSRAVMQQALEALERGETKLRWAAIAALKQALAEPEQEPVAWNWMQDGQPYSPAYYGPPPDDDVVRIGLANGRSVRLLYTAPTPRKPLTDWEMVDIYKKWNATPGVSMADFARAIERAHGIGGGE